MEITMVCGEGMQTREQQRGCYYRLSSKLCGKHPSEHMYKLAFFYDNPNNKIRLNGLPPVLLRRHIIVLLKMA